MTVPQAPAALDPDQAASIFVGFAANEELALRFPADGCYARTHLMAQWLIARGLAPVKVWAFTASITDPLWVETSYHPDGRVRWRYHVAPALLVRREDGSTTEMVFDPTLFGQPVTVDEWRNALHDTPTLVRTLPEEPPLPDLGGSGYWPGADPLQGPDVHARETLEEYQR